MKSLWACLYIDLALFLDELHIGETQIRSTINHICYNQLRFQVLTLFWLVCVCAYVCVCICVCVCGVYIWDMYVCVFHFCPLHILIQWFFSSLWVLTIKFLIRFVVFLSIHLPFEFALNTSFIATSFMIQNNLRGYRKLKLPFAFLWTKAFITARFMLFPDPILQFFTT